MNQSLELLVWLAVAGIALSSANLLLWRTRHTLKQARADLRDGVPPGRPMSATTTKMTTSVSTKLATSVTAL